MNKIALLYQSREGQTLKIANSILASLVHWGYEVSMFDLNGDMQAFNACDFDAFLLGCSIRYGRHHRQFCRFVEDHATALNSKPGFFFSVNLTARKPERSRPDNNRYLMKYLAKSSWSPSLVEVFAGALLYSRYDLFNQSMIRLIMKLTGGNTDTSKDIEYTDWQRVEAFADAIDRHLTGAAAPEKKPAKDLLQPA